MIRYYAYYRRADGRLVQILVNRDGKHSTSVETGVTYRSDKAAMADMERLNCR